MDEIDETVLSIQQRQKRAQIMRRNKSKIERAREISKKKMAPEANIRKRAFVQARQLIRRRVAGARGAEYEKLGPSEKIAIDRAVEGKQKAIKKLALRLIPRVKQAESKRLHAFMKGQQIQNHGQPEGKSKESSGSSSVKESLNVLFNEAFPPGDASNAMGQRVDNPVTSSTKKMPPKGKSKNDVIIQYNKFNEEVENDSPAFTSLFKKSEKSGIDLEVLGEVYNRGWNTWTEDCKVSQQQYAFARVNSFINQGKTYFDEDADLHERQAHEPGEDAEAKTGRKMAVGHLMGALNDREKHVITRIYKHGHTRVSIGKDLNLSNGRVAQIEAKALRKMKDHSRRAGINAHQYNEGMDIDEGKDTSHPIVKEYKSLNKHDIKTLRSMIGQQHKVVDTSEFKTKDHAISHLLRQKHGNKKVDQAFGFNEDMSEARAPGRAYVAPFNDEQGNQRGWKSSNKWGKVKYWQPHAKKSAMKHAGIQEEEVQQTNENFIDGKGPGKPGDAARHGLKGKSASALRKIRSSETASPRQKQLAHWMLNMHHNEETELDEKRGLWDNIHAKRKRIKAGSGERMRKPGSEGAPTKQNFRDASESIEDTGNGTQLVDKESKNSKIRKKIEVVDRKPPFTGLTRQTEIQKKIIDENKICPVCDGKGCQCKGNTQTNPKKRETGTDSLVKTYKTDTPYANESINESFNIAFASGVGVTLTAGDLGMKVQGGFALHPSVIEQMDEMEEEARSADVKGVIVRTATGKTVVRKQKVNHKIIGTGNLTDGKPDDTV